MIQTKDFNKMTQRQLVILLEYIRDTVQNAEDAGDALLSIADVLDLDLRTK